MYHTIDTDIKNSNIEYCIDEYVRNKEHRQILKEKWFEGMTLSELSSSHNISETAIKNIVYGIGDSILKRAGKLSKND